MAHVVSICDKCGQEVMSNNDATAVDAIVSHNGMVILMSKPRHFLPVEGCIGSPSRAQYIEGQPQDERGYIYKPENEQPYRATYAEISKR